MSLQTSVQCGVVDDDWILVLALCLVCSDSAHHLVSGKPHCADREKGEKVTVAEYY